MQSDGNLPWTIGNYVYVEPKEISKKFKNNHFPSFRQSRGYQESTVRQHFLMNQAWQWRERHGHPIGFNADLRFERKVRLGNILSNKNNFIKNNDEIAMTTDRNFSFKEITRLKKLKKTLTKD